MAGILANVYANLLATAHRQTSADASELSSHNLVLTPTWMLVVPRRHTEFGGVAINSVGYAGLMLVKSAVTASPMDVLTGCAFPLTT